ncbi:hypothetical protein QEH38_gp78 [Mycobacterium phage LilSpotty]|uniref:Uncharacterized protein n=1 Tax=Mycobacterium phage LilSpotty TaxID=2588512 RepID=A0A4Y6EM80_9CAUD|nr:hypothetical protein QEH38_gp78 [Mycobacterium phage LilSpotty]QDF19810.1 hypothetical protein SEA_LILSPOTTY_78 [Mycobacterium phage LilSpotty]
MRDLEIRIAEVIRPWLRRKREAEELAGEIAAVVQPRIDTVEQLDALPDHSIIRCASGAGWHKQELTCSPGEPWWCAGSEIECPSSAIPLPARVLYTPEVDR